MNRRAYLSLVGAGVSGVAAYTAYPYVRTWEPEACTIARNSTARDAPAEGKFPMYHGNARHAGYVPREGTTDSPREYWHTYLGSRPTPQSLESGPVVSNGRVFVTAGWRIYSLSQIDGSLLWCRSVGKRTMTAPSVIGDTVLVGTVLEDGKGGVMAFDAAEGTRRWRSPSEGRFTPKVGRPTSSPTVHDGTVYVGGQQRPKLSAIDLGSGTVTWQRDVGGTMVSSPAVDDDGVYVHRSGALFRLDPEDGAVNWKVDAGERERPPTVADGVVYASAGTHSVGAWDAESGDRRWTYSELSDEPNSICIADDELYVLTTEAIHVLDPESGRARWTKASGKEEDEANWYGPGVATSDRLYLGWGNGLGVLDRANGDRHWSISFGSRVRGGDAMVPGRPSSPAVAGGAVFSLSLDGRVFAFGS